MPQKFQYRSYGRWLFFFNKNKKIVGSFLILLLASYITLTLINAMNILVGWPECENGNWNSSEICEEMKTIIFFLANALKADTNGT